MRRGLGFQYRRFRVCRPAAFHHVEIQQDARNIHHRDGNRGIALGRKGDAGVDDLSCRVGREQLSLDKGGLR